MGERIYLKNPKYRGTLVYMKIPDLPVLSKHVANHTTLLLLAFKTKRWNVCKAILSLDAQKYPSLDKVERGKVMINASEKKIRRRHSLYHTDDSNENCLNLAIESHEIDICKMIFEKVDVSTLREFPIIGNLKAMDVIEKKIMEGYEESKVFSPHKHTII